MTLKDDFAAIFSASNAIPQGIGEIKQHSLEYRYLFQTIRNACSERNCATEYHLSRIYQAWLALPFGSSINDDGKVDVIGHRKAGLGVAINVAAGRAGLHTKNKITDLVPYADVEFYNGNRPVEELPVNGTLVMVALPTIYDAKGVICLGEWEPA